MIFQFNWQLQADPNRPLPIWKRVPARRRHSEQANGSKGGDASQDLGPLVFKNLKREPANVENVLKILHFDIFVFSWLKMSFFGRDNFFLQNRHNHHRPNIHYNAALENLNIQHNRAPLIKMMVWGSSLQIRCRLILLIPEHPIQCGY